ncbi:hypothetical protein AADZ90_017460 [Aestuariibius sp. 2305UL40-4]|uniref:hypothetical protein n=1 Tax=Aestuariibius violaceus TaxID=3234132 RepID=UPI00345E9EF4
MLSACPDGSEAFVSCTIEDGRKSLDVCLEGDIVTYRFGEVGQPPELAMSVPVREVEFEPWPGVSRSIWEAVTFRRGDYAYEVFGGFHRETNHETEEVETEPFGGVSVRRGEERVAQLNCDPGPTGYGFSSAIYDAKVDAGQCWDNREFVWKEGRASGGLCAGR